MLRFTLRELVLLVALAAMGLGWWVHANRQQREIRALEDDLLMQADFVDQFVSVLKHIGCEIPPDSDPRCATGGPYTRVFYPGYVTQQTGMLSSTCSGPRDQLQRTLDGEFGVRFRNR
ncbi:MAG TPA: hypothetical protein VFV87_01970 [Pirellulaceae bacterium]|nr:hypothetical protein [Pirellulaceae bacterium]